jgi:plasmid stabilization system protein ParE
MEPRRLVLRGAARRDLARHEAFLRELRGADFAAGWTDALIAWLEHRASLGAQFGTSHPAYPRYRTFGYRRQATILAEFTDDTMDVVRIRFAGEDWHT